MLQYVLIRELCAIDPPSDPDVIEPQAHGGG